jgi:NADPH2:quinone reductase
VRAAAILEFGGPEKVKLADLPRPKPARGEILVRTVAAGVNPADWRTCAGQMRDALPHKFPLVLGHDVAGIVEEIGEGASRFRKGDKIWALSKKRVVQWGTFAEYVAVDESAAAIIPPRLLFEEAASVPMAALTAHQALARLRLRAEETVLVHAGAGGVGHFAIQLAKHLGARAHTTASSANQPFVLGLGADGAFDHTREDFRDALRRLSPDGVDAVLDAVGGETLSRSFDVLKPSGRLVSIVDATVGAPEGSGVRAEFLAVEPSGEHLEVIGSLFPRKRLTTHVSKIYPLREAADALRESQAGHVRGKLVLAL